VNKWDERFLRLAAFVAQWSKDPSTKTGAVIVRPNRTVASLGYNGFPRNVYDSPALLADRDEKLARIIHAEMNAVLNAAEPVRGYTLYNWPWMPCGKCAAHMIQAGISRIVAPPPDEERKRRWAQEFTVARGLLAEAGVDLVEIYLDPEGQGQ
jgi:dCMP deaminase